MEQKEPTQNERRIASYRWHDASPVVQMDVEAVAGGKVRCRLIPRDNYAHGELANIPEQLRELGYRHIYADVMDGKNILVVDRIIDADSLLKALRQNRIVYGSPKETHLSSEADERSNIVQRALSTIKSDTLKWSGRVGLAGHAAILADGLIKQNPNLVWGSAGALNPILLSIYGSGKAEINFNEMMEKMRTYFKAEGVDLPMNEEPEESPTMFNGLNEFLSKHPVQIGHSLGSIGAYNLIRAGMGDYRAGNKKALSLVLAGATSLAGNAAVVLVPETKKDKDSQRSPLEDLQYGVNHIPQGINYGLTQPHHVPGKLWEFIQDSPLRFNALLNLSDNVFWFINATGQLEMQNKQPKPANLDMRGKLNRMSPYLSFVTAFSFAFATFLSAISSKNRESQFLQEEMYEPMYAAAAKFLVQLPKEDREDTLSRMAVFLSAQDEVQDGKVSVEQIVEEVNNRIDTLECSPWLKHLEYCESNPPHMQHIA